jgi:hypothetical protein
VPPRDDDLLPVDRYSGPPKRCPDCGGLVYLPCQLCKARRIRFDRPAADPETEADADDVSLEVELTGRRRKRYERLRARKLADEPDLRRLDEPQPAARPRNLGPEALRDALETDDMLPDDLEMKRDE